jgi:hypothetical protein
VTRKITRAVGRIHCGLQKKLYLGNLDAKRDWGYYKDYVQAMWMMLQQERPDDYVIATGEARSVREFLDEAFAHVGLDWHDFVEVADYFKRPAEVVGVRKRDVEQDRPERPHGLGQPTGKPPADEGADLTLFQASLFAAAAELVAALEASDVRGALGAERRREESAESGCEAEASEPPCGRGLDAATTRPHTRGPVFGPTGTASRLPRDAAAPRAEPRPSAETSPAWREFLANFRTPNARHLVITARDQVSFHEFFTRALAGAESVEVTMDRRFGARRRRTNPVVVEHRRAERRARPDIDAELRASGFAVVRRPPDGGQGRSSGGEQEPPPTRGCTPAVAETLPRSPYGRVCRG